jgi:kinesin family protein 6/9
MATQDIVYSALDGYNGTILAYGQTGSGKTYTITGGEHYADRGIIPRVLSTIFEEFERRANMRYSCYISFLEIYNESVYDLLDRLVVWCTLRWSDSPLHLIDCA